MALNLIEGMNVDILLADKGYDADYLVGSVRQAVIPPKTSRKDQRYYDKDLYKERNKIERLFNRLKQFRRIATRYDKLALSFLSFIHIAASFLLLK